MFKRVFIIFILLFLLTNTGSDAIAAKKNPKLKLVYITDLNLFPTPFVSKKEKHLLEEKDGLLIYESQAVFLDLIRFINKKIEPDVVIFGGNNISGFSEKFGNVEQDVWQLFLDMVSEIKAQVLTVFGKNEINSVSTNELIRTINRFGVDTQNIWWSYKLSNVLLIGLHAEFFFTAGDKASEQITWLSNLLNENKDFLTIVFLHQSLIEPAGNIINNQNIKKLFDVLKNNPQVTLLLSGDSYLNRIKKIENVFYVTSSSLISFPCGYKIFEILPDRLSIRTEQVPLKGIIKKAEKYLEQSQLAISLYPNSPKLLKKHVLGEAMDLSIELPLRHLKNR